MGEGNHPGLLRRRPPDLPQNQGKERGYSVIRYTGQKSIVTTYNDIELFEGVGTHLFLRELCGSDTVAVRLDNNNANWIVMEEGDVIVRDFLRFWVRSNSRLLSINGGPTEATFYRSIGPIIVASPKKYGFRDGFITTVVNASTTGVDAFSQFATQYAAFGGSQYQPAFFKFGGTLVIKNRDATNSLYVYSGVPGAFVAGPAHPSPFTSMEVSPGASLQLQVENRLSNRRHAAIEGGLTSLCIGCTAGTPAAQISVSRFSVDLTDPESIGTTAGGTRGGPMEF